MEDKALAAKFDEICVFERDDHLRVMGGELVQQFPVASIADDEQQQPLWMTTGLVRVTKIGVLRHHDTPARVRGGCDHRIGCSTAGGQFFDVNRVVPEIDQVHGEAARQLRIDQELHR